MASLVVRNIEPEIKERLRMQAVENGRSMEAEARRILSKALAQPEGTGADLLNAIRARVEPLGGVELKLPDRSKDSGRPLPEFD